MSNMSIVPQLSFLMILIQIEILKLITTCVQKNSCPKNIAKLAEFFLSKNLTELLCFVMLKLCFVMLKLLFSIFIRLPVQMLWRSLISAALEKSFGNRLF